MNLSEALDAALPELPSAKMTRARPPRIDPDLLAREDTLDGETIVAVFQRSSCNFYRLSPAQWQLALLFDGVRSYEEIAAEYTGQTGAFVDPADVRTFADNMGESGFWYMTAQEKNLAFSQKLIAERNRRAKRESKINLAHIRFSGWNPDRYLTWLDSAAGKFIYSPWSVFAMVLLFAFEAVIFISQWSLIGPDAKLYYNFSQKSLIDLAQFWLLFLVMGFIHESSHGLTCKHFGGQVHSMGLMFLYLMPAFYVDVTEMWIAASRLQRLATIIAGIWSEMIVCGLGMIVWLNTQPGQWLHDLAYQVILITGLAVILINLNPLIKLDGYYFLTEAIGIPDLKERSTAFLSGWFQSRILRLPLEVPVVPRRRAPFFVLYAIASGAYSYFILFVVIRFSFNVAAHWLAELAIVPAGALAFVIFRSRLRSLGNVARQLWERNFGPGRKITSKQIIVTAGLAVILFAPLLRDREDAWYVIEPFHTTRLHAAVPGRVSSVLVREGKRVRAGEALLTMTSPMAASMNEAAAAQTHNASFNAFNAELQGQSIGPAAAQRNASQRSTRLANEAQSSLVVAAPEDGMVLTENPGALLGQDVGSGQLLLDLAGDGPSTARVYIPTAALQRIPPGAEIALMLPGRFSAIRIRLPQPGGDAVNLPEGLVAKQDYKGIKLPVFYSVRLLLPPLAGSPRFGEAGHAKIFGNRHSLAQRALNVLLNLVKAHVW
jgi:putative peptide zinc metalloprotease protein